jgi:hypothetical protein
MGSTIWFFSINGKSDSPGSSIVFDVAMLCSNMGEANKKVTIRNASLGPMGFLGLSERLLRFHSAAVIPQLPFQDDLCQKIVT